MKYQVTASEYSDLSEDLQALYGSVADDKHTLKVEGLPKGEDVSGLKKKVDDLLTEKKLEQDRRKKAEDEAAQAVKDSARKKGDFEQLLDSSEKELDKLRAEVLKRDSRDAAKDVKVTSMEISAHLADGDNQELLSSFISQRLRVVDGAMKVTDKNGELTISTTEQLTEEFRNDDKYASLVTGSKAAGGGAKGTNKGGGAANKQTATKAQWDTMNPQERMEFSTQKGGGQVTET